MLPIFFEIICSWKTTGCLKIGILRIAAVLIASLCFIQNASYNLCEKCFKSGNYDKDKLADEFKLMDGENSKAVWTEAETLLLLESALKHGDDWDLVAQNVKTKSKLDCISKLIQLPFGDLMLGSIHKKIKHLDTNGEVSSVDQAQGAISESGETPGNQSHEQNQEHQQNGDGEDKTPPLKKIRRAPIAEASSFLMKQVHNSPLLPLCLVDQIMFYLYVESISSK